MSASLPPGWARYTTDEGKEYFNNAATNTTTWDRPEWPGGLGSDHAEVFEYKPSAGDLEAEANMKLTSGVSLGGGGAQAHTSSRSSPTVNTELVSLHGAPSGNIGSGSNSTGTSSGDLFGGLGSVMSGMGGSSGDAPASSSDNPGGISGWVLGHAQRLFDVSTDDVVQRLRMVLIPHPPPPLDLKEDLRSRPDFYGPFWIATTAVLFLAATGNFARLLETGDHANFKADYGLVSLAAGMIYGCLLAVPAVIRACLFISGEEVASVDFRQMICICGYSLAPTIPVSLLCIIPFSALRWLVTLAGIAMSLFFLKGHIFVDTSVKAQWLKWTMIAGPCLLPAVVFIVYRVHFFQ